MPACSLESLASPVLLIPHASRSQCWRLPASAQVATGDKEALAWAEYWLGNVLYGLGEPRLSIRHLRQAESEALSLGDTKMLVNIRAALGQAFATACDYPDGADAA